MVEELSQLSKESEFLHILTNLIQLDNHLTYIHENWNHNCNSKLTRIQAQWIGWFKQFIDHLTSIKILTLTSFDPNQNQNSEQKWDEEDVFEFTKLKTETQILTAIVEFLELINKFSLP